MFETQDKLAHRTEFNIYHLIRTHSNIALRGICDVKGIPSVEEQP